MSLAKRLQRAISELGPRVRVDEPLGPLTTYRVGGAAAIFASPASMSDLQEVAAVIARYDLPCWWSAAARTCWLQIPASPVLP